MRRLLGNLISVAYSIIKLCLLKLFHFNGLHFSLIERLSPNVVLEMNKGSKLFLGNKVRVHSGTKIKVRENAVMEIGNGVKVNYNCIFIAKEKISIGDGTEFGPNVLIYDHDHDYKAGLKDSRFLTSPVKIGTNCWIGAGTVILRGTVIGNNCVVGAGCLLNGNYPDNSVIVQKRETTVRNFM